jgi:hypothetical protein
MLTLVKFIVVLANEMDSAGVLNDESICRADFAGRLAMAHPMSILITPGWAYRSDSTARIGSSMANYLIEHFGIAPTRLVAHLDSKDTVGDAEILTQARRVYDEGRSVTKWFNEQGISITEELIAMVYDFQAGTYTREARANPEQKRRFSAEIANGIRSLREFFQVNSILDCGTGEGTTLAPLLGELGFEGAVLGFDASISRTSWALENLSR